MAFGDRHDVVAKAVRAGTNTNVLPILCNVDALACGLWLHDCASSGTSCTAAAPSTRCPFTKSFVSFELAMAMNARRFGTLKAARLPMENQHHRAPHLPCEPHKCLLCITLQGRQPCQRYGADFEATQADSIDTAAALPGGAARRDAPDRCLGRKNVA